MVRNLAMLSVVLFHAVAAYSTVTPHWGLHDGTFAAADVIRHLFDVFQMPVFFFVAGYFALPSLTKQGWGRFINGKLRRIGVPWLIAVLFVIPMMYAKSVQANPSHPPFWSQWLAYLKSFGTCHIGLIGPDRLSQFHFWFLSLLLSFFIVLALSRAVSDKMAFGVAASKVRTPASSKSILTALLSTTIMASLVYFLVMFMVPERTWVSVDLLLFFQPTSLVVYIAFFALGMYADSRQWFEGEAFPGRLMVWIAAAMLLTAGFFIVGREVFSDPSNSHRLSPLLLLTFSFIRTFLCLAFLVVFVASARRFWNRPSRFIQNVSANSYNIYLVHFFFVVGLQGSLEMWAGGPPMGKAAIVFVLALPFSYGLSWVIDRFPRGFVSFLIALFVLHCVGRYIGL